MHLTKTFSFLFTLSFFALATYGQSTYRGIVVDSASVLALKDVHVKIKNSAKGVTTNEDGIFSIEARPTDTLLFTRVGYVYVELPLLFEETAIFIRLSEQIHLLKEITISATRLNPSTITRSPRKLPTPMSGMAGIFSPIDYFSRWQKEKRKLLKFIQENERTLTYLQVVSDQETRELLMEEYSLSEEHYYNLLAQFNQQSGELQYSTDPNKIITSLKSFLSKMVR
jgi:hypothetical protein